MSWHLSDEQREVLDLVCPDHDRTTCSDVDSHGNEYPNEYGYARCVRCAVLVALEHGRPPAYEELGWRLSVSSMAARWVGTPPAHFADSDVWHHG